MVKILVALWAVSIALAQPKALDWAKIDAETLLHFTKIVQINSADPGGSEKPVVDYLKAVLDKEGIETKVYEIENFADPSIHRPNLVARLKGSGKKRPILLMGHTDTVNIDPKKWKHGPFSAHREDGYIYGRGTLDDKPDVVACLMTMLLLKRQGVKLDRDVIFLAESGEEGATSVGIAFMVNQHYDAIDAEYCLAEGGQVTRINGKIRNVSVETTEKLPSGVRLVATGVAGHGSMPLRSNPVAHLAQAVGRVAAWQPPMRMNDTTRTYFERLATVVGPEDRDRFNGLLNPDKTDAIQEYLAINDPFHNSMLRTSISPNIIKAGYRINVIPSEAEATLDIRALPDEDLPKFYEQLKSVINDPSIKIVRDTFNARPPAAPSSLTNEAFKTIETLSQKHYPGVPVLPTMMTGATDMSFLRAKGMQCYGLGPIMDAEDIQKGFSYHSDQERIVEAALYRHAKFHYEIVEQLAAAK
jgi:acetylornithine deacetylase/succinyl-diaminopimelate desuccinylase-like protein